MPIHHYESDCNEIIPNLFLANYRPSISPNFMKRNRIKAVVNVSPNLPNKFRGINYYRIPVYNKIYHIPIFEKHLPTVTNFIDYHLKRGEPVLVHCKSGHRRSVCVVAHYLMKKYGLKRRHALQYIRNIRPTIFNPRWTVHFYESINKI